MTREERDNLRDLRDSTNDLDDKQTIRKAISHIYNLERKIDTLRVFTKAIENEIKAKGEET